IKVYVDGKEVNFSSYKIENYYLFKIPLKNSKKLLIYLAPNDVIFHRDKELVFITELDIPTENSTIIFKVPSGFAITDFYPEFGELKTDGKTISVIWKNVKGKEVFAVYFHPLYSSPNFSQIIFILIVSLLVILFIFVVHLRKVKLKSILSAFPERDREIVEFVLKKKILYQKDMEKKFKISRVRAHRIAKRLEKLGVVKREKLGRKVKLIVSV
ncbi:MAG: hypothetical protein J7L39_02915, partial [Candidatus Aenigmarchaeota archaeon]|nr:hypothetical protein [Candidatus Aenigmarchaeota archaeon]